MNTSIKISNDLYWVGASDRRLELFENAYPIPEGISYNSYLVLDDKNTIIDGVDSSVVPRFIENIKSILGEKNLDYAIINHMEPDHCAGLIELLLLYPNLKFIGNAKTYKLFKQFYPKVNDSSFITVKEKDTFSTGKHGFTFYFAPMVHWPEVMNTYCNTMKILFTADAFGSFGALNGNLFHDEIAYKEKYISEARRYYSNIVGKYGFQTLALLKKVSDLEINMICPLHGPIWRENLSTIIEYYKKWASYTPEEQTACIVYGSIYGRTQEAADLLSQKLSKNGIKNLSVLDCSKTHFSYIISEIFRCSNVILLSSTYSNGLFPAMEFLLSEIVSHNICNRKLSIVENGSWAPQSAKLISEKVDTLKNWSIIDPIITLKSRADENNFNQIVQLAENITNSINSVSNS